MLQLDQLTFGELRDWLSDRLQLRGTAAADIDRRRHETAYEFPLQSWQTGNDTFRRRFARAVNQILKDCTQNTWHPDHFHNLAALIEEGRIDSAARVLQEIAHSHRWLRVDDGQHLHMLVLRTLLGLGRVVDPDFWLNENKLLQGQYPELIFRGLLAHGLGQTFSRLGKIARDAGSVQKILDLFPDLIDRYGLETIMEHASDALPHVTNEVAEEIRNWFPQWEYGELPVPIKPGYQITDEHYTVAGITRTVAKDDRGWDDALPASSAADILKQAVVPGGQIQAA